MISRYMKARAQGKEEYTRVLEEDQRLLDTFGVGLLSAENSLRVVIKKKLRGSRINPWDVIEVGPALWEWLRPLLVELRELRTLDAPALGASASPSSPGALVPASAVPAQPGQRASGSCSGVEQGPAS